MMKANWSILIVGSFLVLLVYVALMNVAEAATFQAGVDTEKTVSCTNATERADGSTLAVSDIDRVEIVISQGTDAYTVVMTGGCTPMMFDLTTLAPGDWDQVGITVDTGGRVSAVSPSTPFTLLAPIIAIPNPPVVLP